MTVPRRTLARVAGAFVALAAASASAEEVVLLPHGGDAALPVERAAAQGAVRGVLESQGLHIVEREPAEAAAPGCQTVDCAPTLLAELEVDLAIAVAVWREDDDSESTRVYVTLVDANGGRFPASAEITEGDVAAAARGAFLDARALQLLGTGPWIHVHGAPEGADVFLDDVRVGTLPYRARIDAGRHVLEVRRPGMLTDKRTIDIPPNATRVVETKVVLTRSSSPSSSPPACGGSPGEAGEEGECTTNLSSSSPPLVAPLILGAAGLALGAIVVADVLADDCARREPTGTCTKRESASAPLAIGLGAVSAAAVAGAIVWYVVASDDDVTELHAGVRFHPTGVTARF